MNTAAAAQQASTPPEIRQFVDTLAYLQAVYHWKKNALPGFSYSVWAAEFGFKSRSYLRLLIMGKRAITDSAMPILIRGLHLKKSDAEYFEKMVRFTQSGTIEQKERYARDLARTSQAQEKLTEIQNHLRFFSNPLIPRLQTLLTLEDLPKTIPHLAETLQTPEAEISSCLYTLQELGLAEAQGNEWSTQVSHFEVKENLGNLALQSFYRKSFQTCIDAIALPVETRNFQSALFPLSPEDYQRFSEELSQFLKQALARYGADRAPHRRLYQITYGLTPVSRPIFRIEKSRSVPNRSSLQKTLSCGNSDENSPEKEGVLVP